MRKHLLWLLCAVVVPPPPLLLAQEDPLINLLNKRSYSREEILQQYQNIQATVSPPADSSEDSPPLDGENNNNDEAADTAPTFRPITPELPSADALQQPPAVLALILPLNAGGAAGAAADVFYQGCTDGLQAADVVVQVDTYAHDGSSEQAIVAYQNAVENGALFVIGPLQKNNVQALHGAYPQAPVNTLLLQPLDSRQEAGENFDYYVLTIDIGEEAAELARLMSQFDYQVMVVSDNSDISRRQKNAFASAWVRQTNSAPEHFYIYDSDSDWQKLFNELRDRATARTEAIKENPERAAAPPLVLFAAGGGDFVRRVRHFSPQGYLLYASSIFFSGSTDSNFLDNLRVMEMPWFAAADSDDVLALSHPLIRTRSSLQQRFYALGADTCRAAYKFPLWRDGWQLQGASGMLQLDENVFRRRGVLSQYEAGHLKPLSR